MKRTKLERRSWLKRKPPDPSKKKRTARIRPRSKKSEAFLPWMGQEADAVRERAHGKCEAPRCTEWGREVHHCYGRGNEPWSSWRYLCCLLCREHHAQVTGKLGTGLNVELREILRVDCAIRLAPALSQYTLPSVMAMEDHEKIKWVAELIKVERELGKEPPEYMVLVGHVPPVPKDFREDQ